METTDTTRASVPANQPAHEPTFEARPFSSWLERRAMLRWAVLLGLGVLGLPFYGGILQVAATFLNAPATLLWPLLGVTLPYIVACWLVLRSLPAARPAGRWIELGLILALGLVARAIFWGASPTISHDSYRYVWDAHLLLHGVSPYTHSPFDPAVQPLRDQAIWPNLRYRNDPTIYPPGAQMLFMVIYLIQPLSMGALKAGLEVCDVLVAVLTMLFLRRYKLDLRRVIIYWWSPIPIIEFAFSAHVDVAAIVWMLASLLVLGVNRRSGRGAGARASIIASTAGILLGMAVLTKLYPALYAVVMVRRRRDWLVLAGLLGTIVLVYLAFWPFQAQSGGFLSTYARPDGIDRGVGLVWLTLLVQLASTSETAILLAQGAALAALSLLIGWFCWWKGIRQEAGVLAISVLWILLATHLFTWYIAVLLPLLALYLRVPIPPLKREDRYARPADLSGRFATPALGIWLFTLLMPFTYVTFAAGLSSQVFLMCFYVAFAVAALPLLTGQGREVLRGFLRFPARPATIRPMLMSPQEEDHYATDQAQPASGQPAR